MNPFDQSNDFLVRISGPDNAPAVIYVPGIHGDWTPMWRIRGVLNSRCRLIEVAYPRAAANWSLEDYVARLRALIDRLGIASAHLLAESFGSLVGWSFACAHPKRVTSLMIAGGFCCSPGRIKVALGEVALRLVPAALLDRLVDLYLIALIRRGFPREACLCHDEFFPATRTRLGWRATLNRLRIIRKTDLRARLCELSTPIFYFGGAHDRIVPVRRVIATLQNNLRPDCDFRCILFPMAPHPIIPSRYRQVAQLIFDWIRQHE